MYARFPWHRFMKNDWIVYPVNDLVPHEQNGRSCVCEPKYYFVCDCDDGEDCFKCGSEGKIEVSINHPTPVMIVHNAFDERE